MTYPQQPEDAPGLQPSLTDLTRPVGPRPYRTSRGLLVAVAAVSLLVGVAGGWALGLITSDGGTNPPGAARAASASANGFAAARDTCGAQNGAEVSDGGRTLVINGSGEEDTSGVSVEILACVLGKLGTPTAVVEQMAQTRALDGRQEAEWGKYHASWSYHPDNGLDVIVEWRG